MTDLQALAWACTAIKGLDKLILLGWVAQLEEGNDTVYVSKRTIANWAGVSDDTVYRCTKHLVEAGIMINTGEVKTWEPGCETPIYRVNVQKLADLTDGTAISGGVAISGGCY